MPYNGVPKEDWAKVDRCVDDVIAKGKDKDRAVAICISAIKGNASLLNIRAATDEDITALQEELSGTELLAQASELPTNAILVFEDACLAKAEVNRNNDGITDEGIKQLADTIRLMPLTEEHENEPRGVFTRGRTNEDSTECLVSGYIWAGRFKQFASEVQDGTRRLSMDAEAKMAVCSLCGKAFTNVGEYCSHMKTRGSGAVRWLYDLTAVAGGAVLHPAGTGTVFPGREGMTIISHQLGAQAGEENPNKQPPDEQPRESEENENKVESAIDAQAEWWKRFWKTEGDIPTSKFADKKNRKYPYLDPNGSVDKEGWMAAWKYAHAHSESAVINVLKKHLPKGYKLDGDHVVKGGKNMKIVCEECGHEHEIATEAEKIQAELDAKIKELEEAQAALASAQEQTEELQGTVANLEAQVATEQRVVNWYAELATAAGVEFANDTLPSLRKVDEDVFKTFKSMAAKMGHGDDAEDDTPPPPEQVVASAGKQEEPGSDTWTFVEE